jgi:nicotinamidase-related amidase
MLSRASAALIVIDFQGNLFQAMQEKESLEFHALQVIKGAKVFNLPIILTEQTPQKLGPTIPSIAQELNGIEPVGKETFSCWGTDIFREKMEALSRRKVILIGIESHVCVYQTAKDLIKNGYTVYVVADAVSSRTAANCAVGLETMKSAGAHITSAEMLLFELLRSAGDAKFKEIYKIVK